MINASGLCGPCSTAPLLQRLRRREGIALQFAFIEREQRLISNRQLQHVHALGAGGFRLGTVRRDVIRHDDDLAQANLIRRDPTGLR